MRILLVLLFSSLIGLGAKAKTRIAFLSSYDRNGNLIQYEPGGRFVHTAIQFDELKGHWLNAYPKEGVAIITQAQLEERGTIVEIIDVPQELTMAQVTPYLGIPFDYYYTWTDEYIYCSELIAKLFDIPTQPMRFNQKYWPPHYWKLEGTPGFSPDGLYIWAKQQTTVR